MADATDYLRDELINWMTDDEEFDAPPANLYLALHDDDPGDDAADNEIDAEGYTRYETTIPDDWNQPAVGEFENADDFVFEEAEEDWPEVSHFSLWDGPEDTDNALARDSLVSSVNVTAGDAPVFRAGNLSGIFE